MVLLIRLRLVSKTHCGSMSPILSYLWCCFLCPLSLFLQLVVCGWVLCYGTVMGEVVLYGPKVVWKFHKASVIEGKCVSGFGHCVLLPLLYQLNLTSSKYYFEQVWQQVLKEESSYDFQLGLTVILPGLFLVFPDKCTISKDWREGSGETPPKPPQDLRPWLLHNINSTDKNNEFMFRGNSRLTCVTIKQQFFH
jgi:hypothetical protein